MFDSTGLLLYLIVSIFVIIPFWRIFAKAGFHPTLSLLTVVPIVNLFTIYYIAFSVWLIHKTE
jgi:hypothetical protein